MTFPRILRQVFSSKTAIGKNDKSIIYNTQLFMAKGEKEVEFNFKNYKKDIESKMTKSIESMQAQFNTIRAGQANPAMLDRIFVDYFGTPTPLNQLARVAASGSQQITIEPFDKAVAKEIEKAIATSDLNLTPTNDGS